MTNLANQTDDSTFTELRAVKQYAREEILLQLCVLSVAQTRSRYRRARPHMPFTQEAFEFWLHVEERLTIIKDRTFVELSPLLGISSESSPATVSVRLEKEWKEPLAEIVNRLNEHPIMMGCPPARLVTKGEGERFRFAIEFS